MTKRPHGVPVSLVPGIFLLALALSCQTVPEGDVAARVGDSRLTVQELEARIPAHVAARIGQDGRRRAAEEWVVEELLYQEALRLSLAEDPIVAERIDLAVRDLLVTELLDREMGDVAQVSEDEIQAYYEVHAEDFARPREEIRARHVLVESRSDMQRVRSRLEDGELLDRVAREESIDASAEDGGDLGYFTEDMVSAAFWDACRKAPLGRQVRERTALGYHLIEVLDKREAGTIKDLSEVRSEIRQLLLRERRQAARDSLLAELRSRTEWQVALSLEDAAGEPADASTR